VGVPIVIFVVLLSAGVWAGTRWLPDLAAGIVGGAAFFVTCGLLGAALAVLGLRIYGTVEDVSHSSGYFRRADLSLNLVEILFEPAILLALACGVYLLSPPREDPAGE
jgi:hypothetical protein